MHVSQLANAEEPSTCAHLVVHAVLGAKGADKLLRLGQVVPRQCRKQVVLDLAVQPAGEPEVEQVSPRCKCGAMQRAYQSLKMLPWMLRVDASCEDTKSRRSL